jgi:hypothetical protein
VEPTPLHLGTAGRSAERISERASQRHEHAIRERFPRVGRLVLALSDEPQAAKTYRKGAAGERLVGKRLDALAEDGVVTLHDRRKPGGRANIDHIAIGPTGVFVIDAKKYKGKLERRDRGGWFTCDERLFVNGRDRTVLADGVRAQAEAVRDHLGAAFDGLPVRPVLCFVDVEVSLLGRPFLIKGVTVTWPRAMQKAVAAPGPVAPDTIHAAADHLARQLPPA